MFADLSNNSDLSIDVGSIGKPKLDINIALPSISGCRQGNDLDPFSSGGLSRKFPTLGKLTFGSHFQRLGTFDPQLHRITRADDGIERVPLRIGDMPSVRAFAFLDQLQKRIRVSFGRIVKDVNPLSERATS